MINKNQITYFFGAGASYHAIPTIDGIYNRIKNLIQYLTGKKEDAENENLNLFLNQSIKNNKQILENIIGELEWLHSEAEQHQTVDTLAKRYYVQREDESLCRLKRALMIYFFFEQNIVFPNYSEKKNEHEELLDKRYDNLVASIAERGETGIKLKDHIKIITWNYDLQIDLALRNYFNGKSQSINKIKNELNIHPNKNSYDLPNGEFINRNSFAALKLNGNAFLDNSFKNNSHDAFTINDYRFLDNKDNDDILGEFILKYEEIFQKRVIMQFINISTLHGRKKNTLAITAY